MSIQRESIKRPPIQDMKKAVEFYYTKEALGNKEISELFGIRGKELLYQLKRMVRNVELERGLPIFTYSKVGTPVAYEVWGIDIKELERKLKRLKEMEESGRLT